MPYNSPQTPLTSKKGYRNRQPAANNGVVGTSGTIMMAVTEDDNANPVPVGYVRSLNYSTSREVKIQRHILYGDGGAAVELTPGPETITIDAEGIALYGATLGGRLAGTATGGAPLLLSSLHSQHKYFDIVQMFTHPATGEWLQRTFGRCLIKDLRSNHSIDNADIAESCSIQVSYVEDEGGASGSADVSLDDHDYDNAYATEV